MNEIEQAYKVLGVKPGASLREVDEAFHDLKALWQPDRLEDNPRLKAKAAGQLKEIEEAYRLLLEHLGRTGPARGPEGNLEKSAPHPPAARGSRPTPDKAGSGNVSLYEAAFSGRSTKKPWSKLPIGILLIAAIGILTVVAYLLRPTDLPAPAPDIEASGTETVESKLARIVDDVRNRETDGSALPEGAVGETPEDVAESAGPVEESVEQKAVRTLDSANGPGREVASDRRSEAPAKAQETRTSPPAPKPQPSRSEAETETPASRNARTESVSVAATPAQEPSADRPKLARREAGSEEGATEAEPPPEETGPSPAEQAAFDRLKKTSPVASRLIDGGFESLRYANWRIVQDGRDEYWIDIVCNWVSGGNEVHFIWAVSKSGDSVRPMSQAARNLESDYKPG